MPLNEFEIIDISQPVSSKTACFPGDVPFSHTLTVSYADSQLLNLTAITLSPHVGTHTDSPAHVLNTMSTQEHLVGAMPLVPFVGPVTVIDLSPMENGGIGKAVLEAALEDLTTRSASHAGAGGQSSPVRLLIKTQAVSQPDQFKEDYPYFDVDGIEFLHSIGALLVGIDVPSVDHIRSKTLDTHRLLIRYNMCWLENLDLSNAAAGNYFLVAPPIKLMEAEAAPVRALLLRECADASVRS